MKLAGYSLQLFTAVKEEENTSGRADASVGSMHTTLTNICALANLLTTQDPVKKDTQFLGEEQSLQVFQEGVAH
jgi:hypothetical protein